MTRIARSLAGLDSIEDQSRLDSPVHRLHPLAKFLATLAFLAVTASMPKRELAGLAPLALYPVILVAVSGIPLAPILKGLALASPLVLGLGALNPLFDRAPVYLAGAAIPGGYLVLASIAARSALSVSAALALMATTGIAGVCEAMRRLGAPGIFVLQVHLAYRYLFLLMEEVERSLRAHGLRSPERGFLRSAGLGREARGSLPGRILVRTYERASRIHEAMLLRGFDGAFPAMDKRVFRLSDWAFALLWPAYFLAVRLIDVSGLAGALVAGGR